MESAAADPRAVRPPWSETPTMPRKTLHEVQAEAAEVAEALLAASLIAEPSTWEQHLQDNWLNPNDDDLEDWMLTEDDQGFSELLELASLDWEIGRAHV